MANDTTISIELPAGALKKARALAKAKGLTLRQLLRLAALEGLPAPIIRPYRHIAL